MSWYDSFKTGTKDYLTKGNSKGGKKSYSSYGSSSWWMGGWDDEYSKPFLSTKQVKSNNLYKLAASRRAIANFVNIVTGKNIPVKFSTKGDSYTDGKVVTISSKIDEPKEFDVAVGLALHEGSHIKLSDFKILGDFPTYVGKYKNVTEMTELARTKGVADYLVILKDVLNWVEDRRIDQFIFTAAPGYRDYYRALYDKYFNDPMIDKAMKSDEFTDETLESYLFRLFNLQSKFTKVNALKNLPKIYKTVELGNISRLNTTDDCLQIAIKVLDIILESVPDREVKDDNGQGQGSGNGKGRKIKVSSKGGGSGSGEPMDINEDDEFVDGDDEDGDGDGEEGDGDGDGIETDIQNDNGSVTQNKPGRGTQLTDKQREFLEKKMQKQRDFLRGNIKKSKVTSQESQTLQNIEQSGSELKVVGEQKAGQGVTPKAGIECIVVKKLTKELLIDPSFPLTDTRYGSKKSDSDLGLSEVCSQQVADGIRIGTLLGKKLQTRSESRETIFNRQEIGKIDRRMIASLGYGNDHVFFTKEVDMYKRANLHISVDASGSMGGSKWNKTMTNVVALAKAIDMIPNLEIQISFRTTQNDMPYVVLAYDSRVDKFTKVKQFFQYFHATGTTPEGLCYEALMKNFLASSKEIDSYFLNISDGEPYFHGKGYSYQGSEAAKHTRKMMEKIKGMGINVLSYFVSDYDSDESSSSARLFRECYGANASFINVTNVQQVIKTINKLFMSKAEKQD
jgi:hypothetical protein